MKAYCLFFGFAITCVLFSSCSKEKELTNREKMLAKNAGTVSVDMNGKPWAHSVVLATFESAHDTAFSLGIFLFKPNENYSDDLSISRISCTKEMNIVYDAYTSSQKITIASFSNVDYDIALARYSVVEDSTEHNYVKIESYNSATKEVKGSFQLSLYFSGGELQPGYTDTLRFTNGKFNLKISPAE